MTYADDLATAEALERLADLEAAEARRQAAAEAREAAEAERERRYAAQVRRRAVIALKARQEAELNRDIPAGCVWCGTPDVAGPVIGFGYPLRVRGRACSPCTNQGGDLPLFVTERVRATRPELVAKLRPRRPSFDPAAEEGFDVVAYPIRWTWAAHVLDRRRAGKRDPKPKGPFAWL